MEPTDVILSLGSLVQLKTDAFGTISGIERIENFWFVITHCFIRQDEQEDVYVYLMEYDKTRLQSL